MSDPERINTMDRVEGLIVMERFFLEKAYALEI